MIQDARVLQDEFIPAEVQHRDAEVNEITNALSPITHGRPGDTTFLFGPSGAGKTCISRFAVERLREQVVGLNSQYVNCWDDHSRFRTLYRILDGIGETFDIHRQSTPHDVLLDRLREYDGPPYVIILDEVDQLDETDVLYDLYRLPKVTMILIANREEELFADFDSRVRSRLTSSTRVQFDRYHLGELVAILEDRVEWGLAAGVIEPGALEFIADAAAGDARVAIGILRQAAERAQNTDASRITTDLISEAIPEARESVQQRAVDQLTPDQQVVYEIVRDSDGLAPKAVYERYCDCVEDPRTMRTVRKYLSKLAQYNLVEARGTSRDRVYQALS
jgi:orc1/cdc6 family replication initiation protein